MVRAYFRHAARFTRPARLFLFAQALYGVGQTAVWVLRNLYLKASGFDEDFIGYTLAVQSLGMAAVVLVATPFMDRMRFRPFQAAGVLAVAAGLAGVTLIHGKPLVLATCFVTGLGLALLDVGAAPFLVRHSTSEERPYLFGVATALSPASGLVATLGIKGGALAWGEHGAAYGRMLLMAAVVATCALAALALVRESPPERAPLEGDRFDWRTAVRFFLPEIAFGLGAGLTIPFINLYFRNRFHVPAGDIGLYYSAAQALMLAAFLLAPVVARRLGSVRTIVIFQLSSIPFFLVLAFATSPALAVGAILLRHACMNMIHPVGANFAMEVVRPRQRARVNGLKQAANKLSWVVANSAGGLLVAQGAVLPYAVDGFTTTMLVTIVLYVAGSAMVWRFFAGEPAGRVPAPEGEPAPGA